MNTPPAAYFNRHHLLGVEATVDEIMDKLDRYLGRLKKTGAKIPKRVKVEKPHFKAISAAANIDFSFLIKEPYKNRIALAVGEIGLEREDKNRLLTLKERAVALLKAYLHDLEKRGLRLPEDPGNRGTVLYAQVEAEAGLGSCLLTNARLKRDIEHNSDLLKIIDTAAPALGLEMRILRSSLEPADLRISYRRLLESGTVERKRELEKRRGGIQQLYNTRWALGFFRRALGLDKEAVVGHELLDEFIPRLHEVLNKVADDNTSKKVQTEAKRWSNYYQRMLRAQPIPEDIHGAIAYLIDASGLSMNLLSKLIGIPHLTLRYWYKGLCTPKLVSKPALSRMEELFKLPAGTLLDRVPSWNRKWRLRSSEFPEFLRKDPALKRKVVRHLPANFSTLPVEQQREIVDAIRQHIVCCDGDDYARRQSELMKLKYRLTAPPARLKQELDGYYSFKTARRPPLGMQRNQRWRSTTKKKREMEMACFFGALRLPADAAESGLRGLGMPAEHLTTALVACPLIVDWYLRFRGEARTQYTEFHERFITGFQEMLRPTTGWLRQSPQFAARLVPVYLGETELVSPEFIARALSDWGGVCDEAIERYEVLRKEMKSLAKPSRDPFRRIEGIVEMDDPMRAIEILVAGMRQDWPNQRTAPTFYHIAVRDTAVVLLIALTSFRRLTLSQLEYTSDESGHLFRRDGKYILEVPRHLFKEENSPFFGPKHARSDYSMEIPDVYGFNEIMTTYLTTSRPWLLEHAHPSCTTHPLFVSSKAGKTAALSANQISQLYADATELHLVENQWCGTGIPKVGRHRPHSARHIRGTAVIKKTGSFQLAGDANHSSEETARKNYTRFVTKDRNRRVNKILFDVTD